MGMDRILDRLSEGQPPLRQHELADLVGYHPATIRKLLEVGTIHGVGLTHERRIPIQEARRLLVDLKILRE